MDVTVTTVDALTWQDIWLAGLGSALVGGVVAALVAVLTVRLTQSGDQKSAQRRDAHGAAVSLQRALHRFVTSLGVSTFGRPPDYGEWTTELLIQLPVLEMASTELAEMAAAANREFFMVADWLRSPQQHYMADEQSRMPGDLLEVKWHLGQHVTWLGENLSRFRKGQALLDSSEAPEMVKLKGVDRGGQTDDGAGAPNAL